VCKCKGCPCKALVLWTRGCSTYALERRIVRALETMNRFRTSFMTF
jgi:hypothetical protein